MKKIVIGVFFACFVFLSVGNISLYAQEEAVMEMEVSPTPSMSPTPTPVKEITYDLPYPGILPDNPLYFLKTFRDRIVNLLISDPQKKAEFDLLNSDKRVSSGTTLIGRGKDKIAVDTISKSNNYFFEAIKMTQTAQKAGKDMNAFIDKIKSSRAKHEQLIKDGLKKIDSKQKGPLEQELKRIQQMKKDVDSLKKKQ